MTRARLLERMASLGAAAQAGIAGVYAWGVTVVPAAWSRGGTWLAKAAAVLGLASLIGGALGERRWAGRARVVSMWGFVLGSALAWAASPAALAPARIDAARALAGMAGWALFALASAAPALERRGREPRVVDDDPLVPRKPALAGDGAYVVGGALLAVALQVVGWRVVTPERALVVRFVALATGVAVLGAATDLALARHVPRARRATARRLRGAMAMMVALTLLGLSGLLFVLRS